MLCRHGAAGATLGSHNERHTAAVACHQSELRCLVHNLIHAKHGEINI